MGALLVGGGQEHLHLGMREHGRADVAPLDHVVARVADAALLLDERLAHRRGGGHGAHRLVDVGRADGGGHVGTADGDAGGRGLSGLVRELDVVGAGDLAERGVIVQGHAVLDGLPCHGAVHRARIEAREAQFARHGLRDRGLARPAGAVDCDDHRANLSISDKKPG